MIVDTLENLASYIPLNPLIVEVVAFIKNHDLQTLSSGVHVISGDEAFVNIQTIKGKSEDEAVVEYHRKMIDIQVPLEGTERYGYTPLVDLPTASFDEGKDLALLPGIRPQTVVAVRQGQFVLFTPQDGHAPCISSVASFKKAIFKIKA